MTEDRYSRQKDIIPAAKLKDLTATVIGVGAIGRQVALQLTSIGVNNLILIDHDTVEITNLSSQGYREDDLGDSKTIATFEACCEINKNIQIKPYYSSFADSPSKSNVIFCCVDRIDVRRYIWENLSQDNAFFCDGRMSAEAMRIITACDEDSRKHYPTTLFTAEQAHQGSCTAKSTIYCANIAAGFMVTQFAKFLRNIPIDYDFSFNLLTNEIGIMK